MRSGISDSRLVVRGWLGRRLTQFDLPKVGFGLACLILLFGCGVIVGRFQIFPYGLMSTGAKSLVQVYAERETVLRIRPTDLLQPARYEGNGVTHVNRSAVAPGLTFLASFFGDGHELRLIDLNGVVVHRWPIRFFEIFRTHEHVPPDQIPQSEWNLATHGALILPDGSVVVTFNFFGTAKLDRCGAVQWTVPQMTHHSLEPSADGGFWIPGRRQWKDDSPFPVLRPPYDEDTILKVSADGEVLSEISILDILFNNRLEALLFANGLGGTDIASPDIMHLNDVEELMPAMAAAFPGFRSGDLLLSLRNLNLLIVVDPATLQVKWHRVGPWIAQHDPDFQPAGRISVYESNVSPATIPPSDAPKLRPGRALHEAS